MEYVLLSSYISYDSIIKNIRFINKKCYKLARIYAHKNNVERIGSGLKSQEVFFEYNNNTNECSVCGKISRNVSVDPFSIYEGERCRSCFFISHNTIMYSDALNILQDRYLNLLEHVHVPLKRHRYKHYMRLYLLSDVLALSKLVVNTEKERCNRKMKRDSKLNKCKTIINNMKLNKDIIDSYVVQYYLKTGTGIRLIKKISDNIELIKKHNTHNRSLTQCINDCINKKNKFDIQSLITANTIIHKTEIKRQEQIQRNRELREAFEKNGIPVHRLYEYMMSFIINNELSLERVVQLEIQRKQRLI